MNSTYVIKIIIVLPYNLPVKVHDLNTHENNYTSHVSLQKHAQK